MKKSAKGILAALSIWPAVYMTSFFVCVLLLFGSFISGKPAWSPHLLLRILIPFHIGTIVLVFALGAFYIHHVFKNNDVESDKKLLWVLILFLGNILAMPVYWYLYIWRDQNGSYE